MTNLEVAVFGVGLPELGALLVAVLVVAWWVARDPVPEVATPTRESSLVTLVRLAGLVLGLALAWQVADGQGYGRGLLPAPAVLGLVVLVAVALGETVVRPARATGPRTASLVPRRVRDHLPRRLAAVVGLQAAALLALVALTTATASRDEYTDSVRALACSTAAGGDARTPYPGSFYTLPLLGVLALVAVVAVLAARRVVLRPRGTGDDTALRRQSLAVVTAAVGVAVSAPYLGVAVTAGSALAALGNGLEGCAPGWAGPLGVALLWSLPVATGVLVVCTSLLLSGRLRPVRDRSASARAAAGTRR